MYLLKQNTTDDQRRNASIVQVFIVINNIARHKIINMTM